MLPGGIIKWQSDWIRWFVYQGIFSNFESPSRMGLSAIIIRAGHLVEGELHKSCNVR